MPIFKSPTPQTPGPTAKHSPARERETISFVTEIGRRVEPLIRRLAPFRVERIVSADGRVFDVLAIPAGSADVVLHPYLVQIRKNEEVNEFRVSEGLLLAELNPSSAITIADIAAWQPFSSPVKVFIEGTITDFEVTEAAINFTTSDWPDVVEFDASPPTAQTKFNRPLAEIVSDEDDYLVHQITTTNLVVSSICYDAFGSLFPLPY